MKASSLIFVGSLAAAIIGTVVLVLGWMDNPIPVRVLTVFLGFYAFWGFCIVWTSVDSHMTDLSCLKAADTNIRAAEAALDQVKALAAGTETGLPEQLLALQQETNPVTKYMGLVDSAIDELRRAKERKAHYEANIASRAAGLLGIVPALFGTEL